MLTYEIERNVNSTQILKSLYTVLVNKILRFILYIDSNKKVIKFETLAVSAIKNLRFRASLYVHNQNILIIIQLKRMYLLNNCLQNIKYF